MKKLLVLLLFCANYVFAQPITGTFGAPLTATGIKGTLVADSGMTIPKTIYFKPTRSGSIRYLAADSTIEVWTGWNWIKGNRGGGGGGGSYTFNAPLTESGGVVSIPAASSSVDGYLSSTHWNAFNNKQAALTGTGFVKSTAGVISYDNSTYLTTETDPLAVKLAGFYADPTWITSLAAGKITGAPWLTSYTETDPLSVPLGRTITVNSTTFDLSANRTFTTMPTGGTIGQYLGKASGTNYDVSWQTIPTSNSWDGLFRGVATFAAGTTMTTTINAYAYTGTGGHTFTLVSLATNNGRAYYVKNRGSGNLTVARAGSDVLYDAGDVTSVTVTPGSWVMIWADAVKWNVHKPGLSSYSETDPVASAINGILKSNGTTISAAVAGTDYIATETDPTAVHLTGVETIFGAKTFNSNVTSVAGFHGTSFYASYTGSMGTPSASNGVYYFKTDGLPYAKNAAGTEMALFNAGGGGSVTSLSVVTANGFAGTVADPTTTPAITLTTNQTGVLVGNGTSMTGVAGTANQLLRRNAGNTAYEFFTPTYISSVSATEGYMAVGNASNILAATSDIQWDDANNIMNIGGSASEGLNSLIGLRVNKGITIGNRIHFNNSQFDVGIVANDGSGSTVVSTPRNLHFDATGSTISFGTGSSNGFLVEADGDIRFGNYGSSNMFWSQVNKTLGLAGATGGNTPLQISRTGTGVNQFINLVETGGGSINIGGLSSSGFLPAITFTPDNSVQNSSYFLSITGNAGASAGFVIDSRLAGGPLTTQDIFAVQSYGNEKFKIQADNDIWINSVANDNALTNLLVYDATNKVVRTRTVASLPGGGSSYTFTPADFDESGSTVSLDATFRGQHDFLYDESFKSAYIINGGTAGYYRTMWTQNDSVLIAKGLRIELNGSPVTADTTTHAIKWNLAVQTPITLTTDGTSGAATFSGGVLNIPQYTGGGGGSPYGLDGWFQFGYGGAFRATPKFRFDSTNNRLLYNIESRFSSDDFATYVTMYSANGAYRIKSSFGGTTGELGFVTFNADALIKNYVAGKVKVQTNDGDDELIIDPGYIEMTSLDTDGTSPTQSGTVRMVTTDGTGKLGFQAIPSGGSGPTAGNGIIDASGTWNLGGTQTADINFTGGSTHDFTATQMGAINFEAVGIVVNGSGAAGLELASSGGDVFASDADFTIRGSVDNTKKARFEVDNNTTGTTRIYTLPDGNENLQGSANIGIFSNKTINHDNNTITNIPRETGVAIEAPTSSHQLRLFQAGASGATAVSGTLALRGTSPSVTFAIHYGTTYGTSAGTIVASNTATTTGVTTMTIGTTAIPANAHVWLTITATSGTVNEFSPLLKWKQ